jgi:hypothetical protein
MDGNITAETLRGGANVEQLLVSVVVEYDDRPDKCTIYPPDTSGIERMSNWITADRDLFVDLGALR